MNPTVQGYAAAVLESTPAGEVRRLAEDLAAFNRELGSNAELRAALTDTSVPGPARRAVVDDLLGGRVSDPARRVAAFAAGAVHAPEVPGAVDWLALRASQAAEGRGVEEPVLSRLASRERVGGYAQALYEDVPTDRLEEIEDELFRFARTVESTPALRAAFTDRDLPVGVRQGLAEDLLGGKVQAETVRLVAFTVAGGQLRDFIGTLDRLVELTAQARGWRVARILAGADVDAAQRDRLSASLSALTGSPVELQVIVDPELLAGVLVRVGDLQVDATARGRIEALREHMLAEGWEAQSFEDGHETDRGTHPEGAR